MVYSSSHLAFRQSHYWVVPRCDLKIKKSEYFHGWGISLSQKQRVRKRIKPKRGKRMKGILSS
jgi:hypothetical protein